MIPRPENPIRYKTPQKSLFLKRILPKIEFWLIGFGAVVFSLAAPLKLNADENKAKPPIATESPQTSTVGSKEGTDVPQAQELTPRSIPGQRIHSVWVWQESKDCLWRLSQKYYGDPWKWKKIYLANRNDIVDPNIIFPKQKIVIPALKKP